MLLPWTWSWWSHVMFNTHCSTKLYKKITTLWKLLRSPWENHAGFLFWLLILECCSKCQSVSVVWAQGPLEDVGTSDHPHKVCFWLFSQIHSQQCPASQMQFKKKNIKKPTKELAKPLLFWGFSNSHPLIVTPLLTVALEELLKTPKQLKLIDSPSAA